MKLIALMVAALFLAGCSVEPREVGKGEFDPHKVAYFQDARTEICFAVVSYSRIDTSGRQAGGLSHSTVPCTPKVLELARH